MRFSSILLNYRSAPGTSKDGDAYETLRYSRGMQQAILARGTELPAGPAGDGCTYSRGSHTTDAAESYLMEFLWGDYKTAVDADLPGRRARARLDGLVVTCAGHRLDACRAPSGRSSGEDVARSLPGRHDLPQEGRIRTPSSEAYNVLRGSEDIYSSISLDNGAYAKQYGSQAVAGRSIVHEQVLQVRRHEDKRIRGNASQAV